MEEARFKEDHHVLNIKVMFQLVLTIVGVVTSVYAYLKPFKEAKLLVGVGAASYMIIMGLYTVWLSRFTISTCFRGSSPMGRKPVWLQSKMELASAEYCLYAVNPLTGGPLGCKRAWNVGRWIHEDDKISGAAFCSDLSAFVASDSFKSLLRSE